MRPTLLVHGIWDTGAKLDRLRRGLGDRGIAPVSCLDLVPNDGSAPISLLAESVEKAARALATEHGERIDLVGFSMGALVSRYFVQRLSGKSLVRRFVSVSGPHAGTTLARVVPDRLHRTEMLGVRDMRPKSELLTDLEEDADPFGPVEVHVLYTPFDLMILPAKSSRLRGAASETEVPVPLHRLMISHPRAIGAIADRLLR